MMNIILGIDPGSRITGYGIIREDDRKLEYLDSGCIRTLAATELSERLLLIYDGISSLLKIYSPNEVAIEQVFMHQNPNSALKLGHARGVAMLAAAALQIKVSEYSARQIKQALVGYGAAEKTQVKHMVVHLLALNKAPQADAADALAIAICHSHMRYALTKLSRAQRRRRTR